MTVGSGAQEERTDIIGSRAFSLADLLKLLRPKQWTKNLIVFAPLLFGMKIHEPLVLLKVCVCFVAFCCASSSIYVLNDIVDRRKDQAHPTKRNRPIASGRVTIAAAMMLGFGMSIIAVAVSFLVRPTLAVVVATYISLMIFYSFVLKHYVLVDVFTIAAGFVLRAIGGAVAAQVPPSGWFLLCTSFGALFLALEKRRQELNLLKSEAESHRKTLTSYSIELLDRLEGAIVPCLLTCYAFYSFQSFHGQWMLLTVPFVVFGIMRYQVLSVKHFTTGSPEEVLLKDRPIQAAIILWILTSAAVVYNLIPKAIVYIARTVDALSIMR